ncbi:COBL7 (COBRA-LIKE 7) [Pyrus ussuriensis x Pyrus communis]|uniref:COBL7 (COBRA-LIKE 7) n=1 Tax=Pyrus ussuriensis x Pyrus communis TaxID=2448454 RepID=A0A5N5FC13_9ROSA|nr:COBL7 (COBRA-LIKE 7) [Pyrus ussuriensis x Pyrus communis]
MHKSSKDFGTTESVKFVTFARLLRSLMWIIEEFLLIVKGLHKYIGSSSHLVSSIDVAYSLEVFFLHPGIVSLADVDTQGLVKCDMNPIVRVSQVSERGDLPKEVTDKVSNQSSK